MSEHDEQVALFDWAAVSRLPGIDLMLAIPNGGQRNKAVAGKLKAEGVKRGVPDIFLPVARNGYHGLFIELKRSKIGSSQAGRATKEQIQWLSDLTDQGYMAVLCVGWDAARRTVEGYLE